MVRDKVTLQDIINLKGGSIKELCDYASQKGIYLPNNPSYVLTASELFTLDPLLAYKCKWGMSQDRFPSKDHKGNDIKEKKKVEKEKQLRESMSAKVFKFNADKDAKIKKEYKELSLGVKKPKKHKMARTPNPKIQLKRTDVKSITAIKSFGDVDAAIDCFTWPSPLYNRDDDFYVQQIIGKNQELLDYYHKKMRAYFGIEHILKTKVEAKTAKWFKDEDDTKAPLTYVSSSEFDKIVEDAKRELTKAGEDMLKKLDEHKYASPIKDKKKHRTVKLPQPLAQLVCSGILKKLDVSFLGAWRPNEVLLIYAEDETAESTAMVTHNTEISSLYYNAFLFGNISHTLLTDAYIGYICLGKKKSKNNKKRYINIVGAELFNEPFDVISDDLNSRKTHVAAYRNITLENNTIRIPINDYAWDMIEKDNFINFYWEEKFNGFLLIPNHYNYLFYTDTKQKFFIPILSNEEDDDDEDEGLAIYKGKNKDGQNLLCIDLRKFREKEQQGSSFSILQRKEWILDWNCVNFKQGYFVVVPPLEGNLIFKPEAISAPGALESFNYLKGYLNDRLQPIHCYVEAMKLTIYDSIRLNEAIEKFTDLSRQRAIKTTEQNSIVHSAPIQMTFNQALSKAKQMTPEDFQRYKSKYIDYLVTLQSKKYKVIPCVERLAHTNSDMTEYAFMFSIECKSGKILIVHENVHPDRSTLLFVVREASYNNSIREIYDFLQSAEINKRSSLRDKSIEIGNAGIQSYRSINHDDLYSWKQTISSYKNYR